MSRPHDRRRARNVYAVVALGAAVLVAAIGCSQRVPTQLVVRIDSDLRVPDELIAVRVVLRRTEMGTPILDQRFELEGGDARRLPGEVGIRARNPDDRDPVYVAVSAITRGGGDFTVHAIGRFTVRQVTVLNVFLAARCRGVAGMCPAGSTCGQCGCEPVMRDNLPPLVQDASAPPTDVPLGDAVVACRVARPLDRPAGLVNTQVCAGDAGTNVRVFAARRLRFGFPPDPAWRQHGFDLDGVCTDPNNMDRPMHSCAPLAGTRAVEDGDEGRDNAWAARLGQAIAASGTFTEANVNRAIEAGRATLAIRLSDIGGSDDGQVQLDLLPIVNGHRPGSPMMPPTWDGTDEWYVDRDRAYLPRTTTPIVSINTAFVYGGTLVARLPSRTSLFFFQDGTSYVRMTVSGATFQGPISGGGRRLGPINISAYLPIMDLRNDLETLGLCPGDIQYRVVSGFLDQSADLFIEGDEVRNAPTLNCNAMSVGMSTEWVEITVTDSVNPSTPIPVRNCDDAGGGDGFMLPDGLMVPDGFVLPDVPTLPDVRVDVPRG